MAGHFGQAGHGRQTGTGAVKIGLSGLVLLALAACTGTGTAPGGGPEAERREILAGLAVEIATLRLVEARPELGPRVVAIAMLAAQAIGAGEAATVAAAKQAVERRVGWAQLMPTERLMAQTLIDLVAADLAKVAPDGFADPVARTAAASLLERIAGAAAMAGQQPAARPSGFAV